MKIKWFWLLQKGLREGMKLKLRTFSFGVICDYAIKDMGFPATVGFLKAPEIQAPRGSFLLLFFLKCVLNGCHILGKNFCFYQMNEI